MLDRVGEEKAISLAADAVELASRDKLEVWQHPALHARHTH